MLAALDERRQFESIFSRFALQIELTVRIPVGSRLQALTEFAKILYLCTAFVLFHLVDLAIMRRIGSQLDVACRLWSR